MSSSSFSSVFPSPFSHHLSHLLSVTLSSQSLSPSLVLPLSYHSDSFEMLLDVSAVCLAPVMTPASGAFTRRTSCSHHTVTSDSGVIDLLFSNERL